MRVTNNYTFFLFIFVLIALGFVVGHALSAIPKLDTSKVLNVVGLYYDLIGVVVLSELLASTPQWKKIAVQIVAPGVLWLHSLVPLGAWIWSLFSHGPSAEVVSKFAIGFLAYSMIPLAFLDETVVFPRLWPFKSIEARSRSFGPFLLLSGVGLQLIAAVAGLKS